MSSKPQHKPGLPCPACGKATPRAEQIFCSRKCYHGTRARLARKAGLAKRAASPWVSRLNQDKEPGQ